ncbi:MAG TPA: TadE family protein [Frankiaceae bacterium]|jgi:Flp pilus assembly protein TadG|nr:TadE family protein [Frankiaceae bacterium]
MTPRVRDESGASIVEFVLVGALLLFVAFGVLQVGLVLHARNVLAADAAEGARHAASLAVPIDSGASVATDLAKRSVPGLAPGMTCRAQETAGPDGLSIAEVTCDAHLRLSFLPVGDVHVSVTGRSLKEVAQ